MQHFGQVLEQLLEFSKDEVLDELEVTDSLRAGLKFTLPTFTEPSSTAGGSGSAQMAQHHLEFEKF